MLPSLKLEERDGRTRRPCQPVWPRPFIRRSE